MTIRMSEWLERGLFVLFGSTIIYFFEREVWWMVAVALIAILVFGYVAGKAAVDAFEEKNRLEMYCAQVRVNAQRAEDDALRTEVRFVHEYTAKARAIGNLLKQVADLRRVLAIVDRSGTGVAIYLELGVQYRQLIKSLLVQNWLGDIDFDVLRVHKIDSGFESEVVESVMRDLLAEGSDRMPLPENSQARKDWEAYLATCPLRATASAN